MCYVGWVKRVGLGGFGEVGWIIYVGLSVMGCVGKSRLDEVKWVGW